MEALLEARLSIFETNEYHQHARAITNLTGAGGKTVTLGITGGRGEGTLSPSFSSSCTGGT